MPCPGCQAIEPVQVGALGIFGWQSKGRPGHFQASGTGGLAGRIATAGPAFLALKMQGTTYLFRPALPVAASFILPPVASLDQLTTYPFKPFPLLSHHSCRSLLIIRSSARLGTRRQCPPLLSFFTIPVNSIAHQSQSLESII